MNIVTKHRDETGEQNNTNMKEINIVDTRHWRRDEGEYIRIRAAMDSGTLDCVGPTSMLPGIEVTESEGSKSGQHYGSAMGHRCPNLGEQNFVGLLQDGAAGFNIQMADITRPLLSVGKITDMGNQVIFGRRGGTIIDLETGKRTDFQRDADGMYQLDFWIPKEKANGKPSAPGFPGPGRG